MLEPIRKTSLYFSIVNRLIACIADGAWAPGEVLPAEAELAKIFDVSRNSIREALKTLSFSGILSAKAGKGTFVTMDALQKIDNMQLLTFISEEASTADLMEARMVIEPALAALAAQRADDEDKKKLKSLQGKLDQQLKKNEEENVPANPAEEGRDVHMFVATIARNNVLMRLIRSIETELNEQRSLVAFQTTEEMETARIDHRRICDAILANDAEEARESMMTHLEHTYDNIKKKQYYKNES